MQMLNTHAGHQRIFDFIYGDKSKISGTKGTIFQGCQQATEIMKSEQNMCGPNTPAEIEGGLKIKDTLKKYVRDIRTEIAFRGLNDGN